MNQTLLRGSAHNIEAAAHNDVETGAMFPLKNNCFTEAIAVTTSLPGKLEKLVRCEMAEQFCLGQQPLQGIITEGARWQLGW